VVDNGSGDGSVNKLSNEFPDIDILSLNDNFGFTGGNNRGIDFAAKKYSPKYFLLLNNDTIVDKYFLTELVNAAESDVKIGALNPKIYFFDYPNRFWFAGGKFSLFVGEAKHIGRKEYEKNLYDAVKTITFVTGCAFFITARALHSIGKLDERLFIYAEDLDWSLRLMKTGFKCMYIPTSVIWHKEGVDTLKSGNQSFRLRLAIRNILIVMKKNARWYHYPTFIPNFIIRYLARYLSISLMQKDFDAMKGVMAGISDFFIGRSGRI
jgi:hypothetical protein